MQRGSTLYDSRYGTSFVVLIGVASLFLGCTPSKPAKAKILGHSLKANGRLVVASLPAPSAIQQEGESIVLTSGPHKIVIELERILLDGAELAKIPAESRNLSFGISEAGLLTIDQDYKTIIKKQLVSHP